MKPPNFYAANGLDRAGHRRREPEWLARQLAHPDSLFVPVWRGQNLVASVTRQDAEPVPQIVMTSLPRACPSWRCRMASAVRLSG